MPTARRFAVLLPLCVLFVGSGPAVGQSADGFAWLTKAQQPDGYWEFEGGDYSRPAVTGFALLAYLGAGETHKHGNHKDQVRTALGYLKKIQDPKGSFGPREGETWLRDHAIATLAMCEAYALTASPAFKRSARQALDLLSAEREAGLSDPETLAWTVMAMKSGKAAGLRSHTDHWKRVREHLGSRKAPETPRELAMELLIRIFLDADPRRDPAIQKLTATLIKIENLPVWDEEMEGGPDQLYWYFGSLGLFQVGGDSWKAWRVAMKDAVIENKIRADGGDLAYSWDPVGPFGKKAGRAIVTSLMSMCMQVYYRYGKVFGSAAGGAAAQALPGWGGNPEGPAPKDREGYDALEENPFRDPVADPLSTFAIDVDTASYSNVRRILNEGRLPVKGAVRIEEFVNYFTYDYPPPTGEVPFSVVTEVAECPWRPANQLLMIGLKGEAIPEEERPPANLVFLLDVSGSMYASNKLPLVKAALKLLVDRMRPEDHVALVVYAGASGVVLPPTPGTDRARILDAIENLSAGGSTNAGAGIELAYELAREHYAKAGINRVILATDGDFNVGTTSRSGLDDLIEEERKSGVFLTVLGVGTGNFQDSQMEALADKGNGNYAYLDSVAEARKVLVTEVGGTLVTIAKDVKIQVEFNPERVGSYRLIGYENRVLAAEDFADDQKDAGEIGAGHTVTALYEITPPRENAARPTPDLKYQSPRGPSGEAFGNELLTVKLRYKLPDGDESRLLTRPVEDPGGQGFAAASDDFRFASAVAAFGMILRKSEHAGNADLPMVQQIAERALGEDVHGHRRGFLEVVELAVKFGPTD